MAGEVYVVDGKYRYDERRKRGIRATGWFQMFCGIATIAFGARSIVLESPGWGDGGGVFVIVGGMLYITSGVLGAIGTNFIIFPGYLATAVITASWAVGQFIWGTVAAVKADCYFQEIKYCDERGGMHLAAVCISFIELVVAITATLLCVFGIYC